jgi:hypothetical protein
VKEKPGERTIGTHYGYTTCPNCISAARELSQQHSNPVKEPVQCNAKPVRDLRKKDGHTRVWGQPEFLHINDRNFMKIGAVRELLNIVDRCVIIITNIVMLSSSFNKY